MNKMMQKLSTALRSGDVDGKIRKKLSFSERIAVQLADRVLKHEGPVLELLWWVARSRKRSLPTPKYL
jgi:hypothetical protein